ncbi:MAG TPA: exonuclease domain-containing protein [Candidatus Dojkabacteria bacterium]|nr:exonuclease domain-containing protein [Candidatus Dojkabacteria bacterium]
MEQKFLFFDTETTDVQSKDIIQLAFLTSDGKQFNEYFKPEQEIAFGAMAVHHITPEFLEDKPSFKSRSIQDDTSMTLFSEIPLAQHLNNLAKEYIWVAHNVEFDMEVLKKKGIEIPRYICTLKVARNMLEDENKRDLESYSLQYLRYYLGLYKQENNTDILPHDAMGDVVVLKNLFNYLQENSVLTPENMMMISKEPQYIRTLTFGKYAGQNLEEIVKIDREYLEWLKENAQDKKDLLYNIDRVLSSM